MLSKYEREAEDGCVVGDLDGLVLENILQGDQEIPHE